MKGIKSILKKKEGKQEDAPPMRKSPRQIWWAGLFLCSLIAMGSTFEAVKLQRYYAPANGTHRWAVGCITTVFLLSFIALALLMIPKTNHLLIGTKVELGLIFVVAGFTCAAVGSSTNPSNGIAVNASGGVSFGNLYYSTWASFACTVAMLFSYMKTERGLDVSNELKARGRRFRLWVILIISSVIVMGSAASCYDAKCDALDQEGFDEPLKYCRRAAFGVSIGCIGTIFSILIVAIRVTCAKSLDDTSGSGKGSANKRIFGLECLIACILLILYCFGVGYITSEKSPGAPLGNLYYSTWISFGLIVFIASSCYNEIQAAKKMMRNAHDANTSDMSSWPQHEQTLPPNINNPPMTNGARSTTSAISATTLGSGSVGEVQVGV